MPKYIIDFYADKVRGNTPCNIHFFCTKSFNPTNWQDTTDSFINLYQDTTDSTNKYQDVE